MCLSHRESYKDWLLYPLPPSVHPPSLSLLLLLLHVDAEAQRGVAQLSGGSGLAVKVRRQREEEGQCDLCYNQGRSCCGKAKEGAGHEARNHVEAESQGTLNDTLKSLHGVQMQIVITE